jgi:hypothetical protein
MRFTSFLVAATLSAFFGTACDVGEGDFDPNAVEQAVGEDELAQTSLYGCFKSPAAFKVCIDTGVINFGNVVKTLGDKQIDWVKFLEKMGGVVVKGGKGSHVKVRMPSGLTETIPKTVKVGLGTDILKRLYNSIP